MKIEDPILDACLDEVLGGRTPPDLSARIMQAWDEQRLDLAGANSGVQRAVDRARAAAQLPPAANGLNLPIPVNGTSGKSHQKSSSVPALPVPTQRRRKIAWEAWAAVASVLVVAAGLAAVIVPQLKQAEKQIAQPQENSPPIIGQAQPMIVPRDHQTTAPEKLPSPRTSPAKQPQAVPQAIVKDNPVSPEFVPPTPDPTPAENLPADKLVNDALPAAPTIEPIPAKQLVQFVNLELARSWQENKVSPAPLATDAEWCRRLFLRLLGRIPTVEEVQAFTKNRQPDRREQLATQLLESDVYADEFNRNWGSIWTNILIGRVAGSEKDDPVRREALEQYMTSAFARKLPYDQVITELLTASGNSDSSEVSEGAIHFLLSGFNKDATVATNRVSRIFLGVNLQCAQCHNHPTNDWNQADYWSLNAFLRQMDVKRQGKSAELFDRDLLAERGDADDAEVYYQTPSGLMKVAYPRFIDGTEISRAGDLATINRRERLAQLVVRAPEMPRALVNRMWSQFFGYGFTKPVDDIGAGNQPSHPELLNKLSHQFVAYGYDLRALMRWIVLSDPFQRSSRVPAGSIADAPEAGSIALFSRYYTRQLQAEEVFDSLMIAAKFRQEQVAGSEPIQARVDWSSQFARSMSTDDMAEESTFDGSVRQSLIMMTGDLMQRVTDPNHDGLLRGVLSSPLPFEDKVQHLFLAALSRPPTKREMQGANQLFAASGQNATTALQDLWWALLNSNEFILDH